MRRPKPQWLAVAVLVIPLTVRAQDIPRIDLDPSAKRAEPSERTIEVNGLYERYLPFDQDVQDFADAQRGLIAQLSPLRIDSTTCLESDPTKCTAIWDLTKYAFLNPHLEAGVPTEPYGPNDFNPAPDSVNPSLWRMAVLNTIHGVFKVRDGIYQVRGYDLSNMSAVVGDTGWIIIDPLTTKETARAALENLNRAYAQDTGESAMQVSAIMFTHSHVDHFGGVDGLDEGGGVLPGALVYASEGFLEEAVSENVIVGNTMGRRASYMYGPLLQKGERGQVDGGLGKSTPAGTTGIAEPDCVIQTGGFEGECGANDNEGWFALGERVHGVVDGVTVQFQNVPGSEAPAEMLFYFPDLKALCASEDVTHTFHNVLTLRGANVRDSLLWAKYLHKTLKYFDDAEVLFASHHWPTWNLDEDGDPYPTNRVRELIELQRDLYRYIHDQSVRLTNMGYTIQEVGELVKLPPKLGQRWPSRSYYGTVNHNAKAVYQRYIGWFDGNPASLHQLPPAAAGKQYIRYMGGVESILEKAREDYDAGHYRWVAMVLNHVVFGAVGDAAGVVGETAIYDPVREARKLLADTYDQLGYQAESGPWRNFYLTGAMELRNGVLPLPAVKTFTRDTVEAMDLEMIFDFIAVHVNGLAAGEMEYKYQITFTDDSGGEDARPSVLYLKNGVLNHDIDETATDADATMELTRDLLDDIVMGENEAGQAINAENLICPEGTQAADCIAVSGSNWNAAVDAVEKLFGVLDQFEFWFNIVTPESAASAAPALNEIAV